MSPTRGRAAVVFGHSWGTLVALAWALDRPDALSALVLAAGYYFATPRPDAIPTAIAAAPVLGDLYTRTIAPLQTRLTGPLGFRMIFSPDKTPMQKRCLCLTRGTWCITSRSTRL